jgi:hypothetical protein
VDGSTEDWTGQVSAALKPPRLDGVSPSSWSWLAWWLCALSIALNASGLVLQELNTELSLDFFAGLVAQLSFVVVGAIVAARRPGNAIGWLFCAIGLGTALAFAPNEYARYTFVTEPGALPAGAVVGWFSLWTWDVSLGLLFTFLLLLFPTGRLASRRWRPVAWVAGGVVVTAAVSQALAPGPLGKDLPATHLGSRWREAP